MKSNKNFVPELFFFYARTRFLFHYHTFLPSHCLHLFTIHPFVRIHSFSNHTPYSVHATYTCITSHTGLSAAEKEGYPPCYALVQGWRWKHSVLEVKSLAGWLARPSSASAEKCDGSCRLGSNRISLVSWCRERIKRQQGEENGGGDLSGMLSFSVYVCVCQHHVCVSYSRKEW